MGRRAKPAKGKTNTRPRVRRQGSRDGALGAKVRDLEKRLDEALAQQAATGEILQAIRSSSANVQPVFDAIVASGVALFEGAAVAVALPEAGQVRLGAIADAHPERAARWRALFPFPLTGDYMHGVAILERRLVDVPDVLASDVAETGRRNFLASSYRAITIIPMLREDTAIGAISVVRVSPGPLSEKQLAVLKTFADQAVIAIENARLFNELEARNRDVTVALERQTATAEVLRVISGSLTDTEPVFGAIAQACQRLFRGTSVGVGLALDGMLHYQIGVGEGGEVIVQGLPPFPLDRGSASGVCVLDCRTLNLADLTEVTAELPRMTDLGLRLGYLSGLWVPLRRGSEAIGVLAISRRTIGAFTDQEVTLAETFADQAVIAIENVRLFNELRERTDALTRSVSQLTALGEVGQAISSTLDLDAVLRTIVSHAVQLTGLDGGAIYEYDEAREVFTLRGGENLRPEIIELNRTMPIRLGEGFIGRAVSTRAPVQVSDLMEVPRQVRARDVLLQIGARALLAVPLFREDHILGALAVIRNAPGGFPPEVIQLLQTFATQSAIAIQNARLFRAIEDKSRQLALASAHKSQFLASMSHELRTPLNAILGLNEMLLGEIYGEVPEDMRAPLVQTQSSGKHLLRLINNVLDLAKIEANRMELALAEYVVPDLVTSVHATLAPLAAEKGLGFSVAVPDDLPLAYGDQGRLTQCLLNLAGNAIKFTKQGRVEISVETDGERLRIGVADTGVGIPADKLETLFTEFRQTDATIASEYGGSGLGLAITKKFIELHGGRIWVESEPGRGSTFLFEVPVRVQEAGAAT